LHDSLDEKRMLFAATKSYGSYAFLLIPASDERCQTLLGRSTSWFSQRVISSGSPESAEMRMNQDIGQNSFFGLSCGNLCARISTREM
jgi:hypothetical protein